MIQMAIPPLIGAALGAAMGHFGKCAGGMCPLTSTWWRGALYGAVIGILLSLSAQGK